MVAVMRQTDYGLYVSRKRLVSCKRRFTLVNLFYSDVNFAWKLRLAKRAATLRRHIGKLHTRSVRVSTRQFNLDDYDERRSLRDFRFLTTEIKGRLVEFFAWDRMSTRRNRYSCNPLLATCVVLRRLATPLRWEDIAEDFGKFSAQLSEIFWEALERMLTVRGHLILNWRSDLMTTRAEMYASFINEYLPLDSCVGFMDCTKQKVARPSGHNSLQRALYSGHRRTWCLKWQTISTPDGLIFHLWGPEDGRRHDSTLYNKSNIDSILEHGLLLSDSGGNTRQFCCYADAAYVLRAWLQVAFPRIAASPEEQSYNTMMNAGRTCVEWSYKDTRQNWTAIDFQRKMKVKEGPVALMNIASMLLWNLKVVLKHGSQTSSFMAGCPPPSWEEYVIDM